MNTLVRLQVDGALTTLPYSPPHGHFSAYRSGRMGVVSADFGLRLKFDWRIYLAVVLPSTYSRAVYGLCGDYNGRPEGELLRSDGQLAANVEEFGESWKVEGSTRCIQGCAPKCPVPGDDVLERSRREDHCGLLLSQTSPFRDCLKTVDPEPY
eukprot:g14234.t1